MTRTAAARRPQPVSRVPESQVASVGRKDRGRNRSCRNPNPTPLITERPGPTAGLYAYGQIEERSDSSQIGARISAGALALKDLSRRVPAPTFVRRLSGTDRCCLAVLLMVPLAVFGLPALFGHMALFGDDATQNYPLRVLVGSQIRQGHLPLLDPYIWSGAPLLGGWNAGAAYPFILLFVLLSGPVAWTLTLVVTWWVAGIGCFAFLRASRLGSVPSFLGSLSFSFAGAMTAEMHHIGLVEGVSWAPVVLLALLRLSESVGPGTASAEARRGRRKSRLGWTAVFAAAGGMVILAGEPRAIADVGVIVAIYARLARCATRARCGPVPVLGDRRPVARRWRLVPCNGCPGSRR